MRKCPASCVFTGLAFVLLRHRFHRSAQSGAIKLWMLIVLFLAFAPLLTLGFYEGRKAYWDAKVREMCAKDGGVKINEVIDVDTNSYESMKNKFGQVDFPKRGTPEGKDSVAVHLYKDTYIRRGAPEVRRSDLIITRTSNGSIFVTSRVIISPYVAGHSSAQET